MDLLTSTNIKYVIHTLLLLTFSGYIFFSTNDPQVIWFVLFLFSLSLMATQPNYLQRQILICTTGLLTITFVWLSGLLATHSFFLGFYFFILTTICMLIGQLYPAFLLPFFIINFFALAAGMYVPTPLENLDRVFWLSVGLLLNLLLQIIFLWRFHRDIIQALLSKTLRQLSRLNEEIFSCFLQSNYSENIYLFEKRLHLQKNKAMLMLIKLYKASQQQKELQPITANFNKVFDLLIDCSQLRLRITDYPTLTVCRDEMSAITLELENLFTRMMKLCARQTEIVISTEALEQKIFNLEDIYVHVLQTAAREPLAFLLFIASLKLLCKEMSALATSVREACLIKLM